MPQPTSAVIEFVNAPGSALVDRLAAAAQRHFLRHGLMPQVRHSQVEAMPAHLCVAGENIELDQLARCSPAEASELLRLRIARGAGLSTVLFVCTGNSIRSQIAEGVITHRFATHWAAFSAGTLPVGIHPDVMAVMAEVGIDLSDRFPKDVELFRDCAFDRIVVLCSEVDGRCPVLPYGGHIERMYFDDLVTADSLAGAIHFSQRARARKLRITIERALRNYLAGPA